MEVTRVTTYINFSGRRLATKKMYPDCIELEDLWENWEELPDSQEKPEEQLTESIVSKEVEYYQNNFTPNNLFFLYNTGYNLEILKDIMGDFYIIHPNENNLIRNILNKIINNNNTILLSINNLIDYKLIKKNYKSTLGITILKIMKDTYNINESLL